MKKAVRLSHLSNVCSNNVGMNTREDGIFKCVGNEKKVLDVEGFKKRCYSLKQIMNWDFVDTFILVMEKLMNEKWIVTRLTIFFFFYFVIVRRYSFGLLCLMFILIPLFFVIFD